MTEAPTTLQSADIVKIADLLPHRYPFLLVDRIVEIDGDRSCIGIKNVTFNEPQFTGHFPSRPIFPGIYLIEGMAQTAGAICVASQIAERAKPKQVFFMTVDKRKFRARGARRHGEVPYDEAQQSPEHVVVQGRGAGGRDARLRSGSLRHAGERMTARPPPVRGPLRRMERRLRLGR